MRKWFQETSVWGVKKEEEGWETTVVLQMDTEAMQGMMDGMGDVEGMSL